MYSVATWLCIHVYRAFCKVSSNELHIVNMKGAYSILRETQIFRDYYCADVLFSGAYLHML